MDNSDLTGRLSLTIAGLDLDATKVVSSHPIPIWRLSRWDPKPRIAVRRSSPDQLDVLRHCLYDRYAALPPISSDTLYGHWVWLAIGDGASAQVEPTLGVTMASMLSAMAFQLLISA